MKIKLFNKVFGVTLSVQEFSDKVPNVEVNKWFRFPWDSTDKVRLRRVPMSREITCSKCKKEINGYAWDVYLVCIGFFNETFDCPVCIDCAHDLKTVMNMYDPKLHPEMR